MSSHQEFSDFLLYWCARILKFLQTKKSSIVVDKKLERCPATFVHPDRLLNSKKFSANSTAFPLGCCIFRQVVRLTMSSFQILLEILYDFEEPLQAVLLDSDDGKAISIHLKFEVISIASMLSSVLKTLIALSKLWFEAPMVHLVRWLPIRCRSSKCITKILYLQMAPIRLGWPETNLL